MPAKITLKLTVTSLLMLIVANLQAAVLHQGSSEGMPFLVEQIAEGFEIPWGMSFIAPEHLLITERPGSLKLLNLETKGITSISGLPKIAAIGQGGLLDVRISPDY